MPEDLTTAAVQRYLDDLADDAPAERAARVGLLRRAILDALAGANGRAFRNTWDYLDRK